MRLPAKIPTALGLFLIIVFVAGISFAFERLSRQKTVASGSAAPLNVQVTNISDTAFSVIWFTESPATGALVVASSRLKNQTVFDERDTTGKLGKYITHSVQVRARSPDTEYSFKILSNGKTYADGTKPFSVRTAPVLPNNPTALEPAYGSVITSENQPAAGALVFLNLEGSQPLSALVKPSGSWLIPLNLLRTKDLSRFVQTGERMTETLTVQYDSQEATAITDTLNDSPVPTMVLGKTYDFRKQQAKSLGDDSLALTGLPSVLGKQTGQTASQPKISISQPEQGANLTTAFPLISGTGIPGKTVVIALGITRPISGTTQVGLDGVWRFTPPQPLPAGKQSVTITTRDDKDKPVALTHTFQIFKSGTQVLGEATPSATLTPTPPTGLTPTPQATPSAEPQPTLEPTPTSTLAGQEIPTSGTTLPTLLVLIIGSGLLLAGAVAWRYSY